MESTGILARADSGLWTLDASGPHCDCPPDLPGREEQLAAVQVDTNGLEVLNRADCLSLLASVPVGRVAASINALPVVLPVNFVVDGERVLFRTGAGTKLSAAADGSVIAFEADAYDATTRAGWSVLVQAVAQVQPLDSVTSEQLAQLPAWGNRRADLLVILGTEVISGRRIVSL
jgi:hypothetical protein